MVRAVAAEEKVKLAREQLYTEIWEISASGVAKKYDVHYPSLLKLCREADIPIPPSGYWIKLRFGKPAEKLPLPLSETTEIELPCAPPVKIVRAKPDAEIQEKTGDKVTGTVKPKSKVPKEEELPTLKQPVVEIAGQDDLDALMPWERNGRHNVYNRAKLYDEVWSKPVQQVAALYGVSNTTIKKVCRNLKVPVPPRGYWAKLKAGKKTKRIPLPDTKGQTQFIGSRTHSGLSPSQDTQPISFLPDPERVKVLAASREMELPAENTHLHKKIKTHKALVTTWNKNDRKDEVAKRSISSYSDRPPFLAGVISKETLPRVYQLLSALYKQVEALGGVVNDDLSVQIRGEHVSLEVHESQDAVEHEITKEEAKAIILYEDAKKHGGWASEPQIRKYDYHFNGRLRVGIRKNKFFRDTDKGKLETRLGGMLIDLYEESEVVRLARIQREEEARKKEEEQKQREEFKNRYNDEVDKTIALENAALDYERALRIRTYVRAVEEAFGTKHIDQETSTWLTWAKLKADWFDPVVASEDEYFDKRDHKNDADLKELKKLGYYW